MSQQDHSISFTLPSWIDSYIHDIDTIIGIDARMAFVIEASKRNVMHQTGGPFAAAIFEQESGKLISLGVNLVTTQNLSMLHAEMVAISLAQKKLHTYDLGTSKESSYELITSTEPCAMCLGAIPWSGVHRVISGASDSDARAIGFDEGPKVSDWEAALRSRQIEVISKLHRQDAADILQLYIQNEGHLYNSREDF
ncbi:MAG: nucleoside deaminase [Campylobacterota bacterium]|nr:nucleoside deaminase [Campylobacterota bacterium]